MRILRGMGGVLLWILASVVCLVALILCATVLLLPLGIPLLMLGRRMFAQAFRLLLPRAVAHPVTTAKEASSSAVKKFADGVGDKASSAPRPDAKTGRKRLKKSKKKLKEVANA
jgi:membrane protein implicated in regulation of membrane protease activity